MNANGVSAALMLGGNQGNTRFIFTKALSLLDENAGAITHSSSIYITEPWGIHDQPSFLNQAILIRTHLSPIQLLEVTQHIEIQLGRKPALINGPRIIDIDILLFGNQVIHERGLEIPHPRFHLRKFNLVPLAEIIPSWIHPVFNLSISELNIRCTDPLEVKKEDVYEAD